jgi:bacillolysin
VRFVQTYRDVPVFGARAVVELTDARELVSVTAALAEVSDVAPLESLSRTEALQRIAAYTGANVPQEAAATGRLNYYKDETESWHLAWLLLDIPAAPPGDPDADDLDARLGHRPVPARYNYLVDAHDGEVLFTYSAIPTALPTPARCTGTDENDTTQTFFGQLISSTGTACRLDDPLRSVRTYDLDFADIDRDPPLPANAVESPTGDYGTSNRAAVSAHLNASRVQDFYKVVLQRDGIDDHGMTLISLVNVTAASMEPPPTLLNAFWYQRRDVVRPDQPGRPPGEPLPLPRRHRARTDARSDRNQLEPRVRDPVGRAQRVLRGHRRGHHQQLVHGIRPPRRHHLGLGDRSRPAQ